MTTETPESLQEIERLLNEYMVQLLKRTHGTKDHRERLLSAITRVVKERDALKAELDLASPKEKCARCGGEFRWYQMTPEEGDEWECLPCNERENARERAALSTAEG